MKQMKKILSITLAAAMLTTAMSTIASASTDSEALYARDSLPINVIANAEKVDHILYYDSATSKLYSKMDYDTKEFSEPIDFPGAICEGNKLTLTSEFQFVTTAKDGLFIDGNTTLYVPEGETPSIMSAVDGFKGNDKLNEYTGIFAADGSTIDVDGTLTVGSGTGTDASGRAILSDGDLKIIGKGSLNAICGDTEHDETADPMRADSIGIYVYGDLDISLANAYFKGGDAYGISFGIVTDEGHFVNIDGGASVRAESGKNRGEGDYEKFYSSAFETSNLTVKNNSSLIASATSRKNNDSYGLCILCGDLYDDGIIYNGSITLENNSSIISNAEGSDRSFGFAAVTDTPIPVKMDNTCKFITTGKTKGLHYAKLVGVTATSPEGSALTYTKGADGLTNSYVDADGNIALSVVLRSLENEATDDALYFDSETGKLYSKYDYTTGEMSEPVEVPGAICEKNKLTLTSDFRFVTTHEDGLVLSEGSTLYVPEGEAPYIQGGVGGFTPTDTSNTTTGIFANSDCTLDIDGTLTAIAGNGVNVNSWGVFCGGNLKITGKGTLNAYGGNTSYDEGLQGDQSGSAGIFVYENIDISNVEVNAYGGDAYTENYGICTKSNYSSMTITDNARVRAHGGSTEDTEGKYAGIGAQTGELTIKNNSSLTASSVSDKGLINVGLYIYSGDTDDNGAIYEGKINLENNSSLTVITANSEYGYGIWPSDEGAIQVEMDDSCSFTAESQTVAGYAELKGVTAMSGENVVTYDSEKLYYTEADGSPVKKLSFRPDNGSPEETTDTTEEPTDTEETTDTTDISGKPTSNSHGRGGSKNVSTTPEATETPSDTNKSESVNAPLTDDIPFTDVKPSDWFYNDVKAAYTEGLMTGVSDTEFAPNAKLTRGMLVTIIGRMSVGEAKAAAPFNDVDAKAYYAPYVAWAAENGIVLGYGDNTFKPDENVTREQVAAIIYRYMKNYIGADVSADENTNILSYTDANEISEYAVSAIQWACGRGIISGYPDGSLAPQNSITRAELTSMISAVSLL